MKKLRKNKYIVLTVCVIVVSLLYFIAQKVIDNYAFIMNNDIVDDGDSGENSEDIESEDIHEEVEIDANDGQISDEETYFVVEEAETGGSNKSEESDDLDSTDVGVGEETQNKIYVYITGEVNCPGVLVLNEGSRIVDAINAAGGTTAKANVSKVNLVYVLEDGMKLNIPSDNDLKNNSNFEYITMNSGDGGNDDYYAGGSSSGSSGGLGSGEYSNGEAGGTKNYSVVNINTATQTELETLPGIGPSLALKIINYRKENGKFSSIEQIKEVSGIGESKFEAIKKYISI